MFLCPLSPASSSPTHSSGGCAVLRHSSPLSFALNKRHLSQPANHLPNSGIPGNEEADRQANAARERRGSTVREEAFTSAANRARRITEQRTAAKAEWEEKRLSKHYGYRDGKAGSRRPVPMKSRKSLASRYYQLKCGHAPTATYLKRFGQRDDDQYWWCGKAAQTREHPFRHCKRWKNEQRELWKAVGRETGWRTGRCRHVQISELFSLESCDQAVMDFLAATEIGKFPRR